MPVGGNIVHVMRYEASRPDATATSAGTRSHVACSHGDVEPWTNVSWDQAQAACCALNASGTCPGAGGTGWRLCDAAALQISLRDPVQWSAR